MRSLTVIFFTLLVLWAGLSGYWTPLLMGLGVLSAAITTLLIARMQTLDPWPSPHSPIFYLRMTVHFVRLLGQMFVSALRVTRLVFKRRCEPYMMFKDIPSEVKTPLGKLVRVNSITLTPGTIGTELGDGRIYMHTLDATGDEYDEQEALDVQVRWLER